MRIRNLIHGKFLTVLLAAMCGLLASAHASAQTVAELIKKGKLTIGVVSGTPPFGSVDAKGVPIGYDIDVANLIGKYIGLPVEIVPLTPPARIPALESGKVDFLVATLAPTPERAKSVLFTIPYSAFELAVVAPVSSNYKTLADLNKKKIAVNRGGTSDTALSRLAPAGPISYALKMTRPSRKRCSAIRSIRFRSPARWRMKSSRPGAPARLNSSLRIRCNPIR